MPRCSAHDLLNGLKTGENVFSRDRELRSVHYNLSTGDVNHNRSLLKFVIFILLTEVNPLLGKLKHQPRHTSMS